MKISLKTKLLTASLALASTVGILAGCGATSTGGTNTTTNSTATLNDPASTASTATQTASAEKILRVGELWSISSVDPIGHDATLVKEKLLITETLTEADPNFNVIPGLATSWENTSPTTWVFKLRTGVKFHDGTTMDAEAVANSINKTLAGDPTHYTKCYLVRADVTGDNEITLVTDKPYAEMPEYMHDASFGILADKSFNADGTFNEPVGTGPFMFSSFNAATGEVVTLKFNDYHGTKAGVDKVIVTPVTDANSRALALEANEIDFTCDLPFNQVSHLNSLDNVYTESYDTARVYMGHFNLKHNQIKDIKVRQAIAYATDKETIARDTLFGTSTPATYGMYNNSMGWTNKEISNYPYNLAKAQQLLEEAGYKDTDGNGFVDKDGVDLSFSIYTYPDRPGLPLIAEAMENQLKKVGIKTEIKVEQNSALRDVMDKDSNWGLYLMGRATAQIPSSLNMLMSDFASENNKYGYSNPELDKILNEGFSKFDPKERFEYSKKAQQIIVDDIPTLFIANYGVSYGFNSHVKNFKFNPTAHDYMFNTDITLD